MDSTQMWIRMQVLLSHKFSQHDQSRKFLPNARKQLRAALKAAGTNPEMIEAFEKDLYSDCWHDADRVKPLNYTQKHLIARNLIFCLFGQEDPREEDFRREAEAAHRLRPDDIQAIWENVWPNRKPAA